MAWFQLNFQALFELWKCLKGLKPLSDIFITQTTPENLVEIRPKMRLRFTGGYMVNPLNYKNYSPWTNDFIINQVRVASLILPTYSQKSPYFPYFRLFGCFYWKTVFIDEKDEGHEVISRHFILMPVVKVFWVFFLFFFQV